jgi:hypothetical protein
MLGKKAAPNSRHSAIPLSVAAAMAFAAPTMMPTY